MRIIRNTLGAIAVVVGAFIFQIGFVVMTNDMQDNFAKGLVEKFIQDG